MTYAEILAIEDTNVDKIYLHRAGAYLERVQVRTVGQQKDDYYEDASSTGISTFNHSWEE